MDEKKFTKEELRFIKKYDTPSKVQNFLKNIPYNFKETTWSFRKVLKKKTANCLEGALFSAVVLSFHGFRPLMICMEANEDIDHNIFIYKKNGKWGSVAISRDEGLRGRKPVYKTLRSLIVSYYPYYYNSYTKNPKDLTLRGFSDPIDLRRFKGNWMVSDKSLDFIEDYLYTIPYKKLFPGQKGLYSGTRKAKKPNYYYCPKE